MIEVVHIVARVSTDMTRFNAGMASMEAKAQTATAKMSLAGMRMTKYLTLPIAGIAYAGIKTATSFQKSMTLIQTQAGASAKDLPQIKKAINDMAGRSVLQGPKDLADAYYHLQSVFGNTISVAKKLSMLKNIGQLAQIGGSNIEDTTSAVAGILRTHLKGAKTIEQVVRTINGIVGSGNMRMPQFVESTGTAVLQVARLLGMSLKNVGAAEAVFTDENMNANMSMTRLRTSLMMAVNPSDKAASKMKELGISSLKIGELMRGPKGFAGTLNYLSSAYDNFVAKLEKQGKSAAAAKTIAGGLLFGSFGGSKGASVWATLIQQHAMYAQKMTQITKKEKDYNKDLADSNKTLSVQFGKAWSRIQVALQDFGDAIAPIVLGVTKALVTLANAFTDLPTPIQHFIAAVGVGLAVLGPMLIVISSIVKIFGDIGGLLGVGGDVALGFGSILPLALIAAIAGLAYFAVKSKTFRAWLESWGKSIQGFFHWLGFDVIGPFFYKVDKYFTSGGNASRWKMQVVPALKAVAHTFTDLANATEWAMKKFKALTDYIAGSLQKWAAWGTRFGNWMAGLSAQDSINAAGARGAAAAAAHEQALKMHKNAVRGYNRTHPSHSLGHNHPDLPVHHAAKPRHLQSHNHPGDAPLVHIAEMHVRHESDAEIVSGKIARKVMIP